MKDLSSQVPGQPVSSESATNTVNNPGTPAREHTAPGSPSVLPPPPDADTDVALDVASPPYRSPSVLLGEGGGSDASPPRSDPWTRAGQSDGPWRQT